MLTWQARHELLVEAARRSPRRRGEVLGNALDELKLGAKPQTGPGWDKGARNRFREGQNAQRREMRAADRAARA